MLVLAAGAGPEGLTGIGELAAGGRGGFDEGHQETSGSGNEGR